MYNFSEFKFLFEIVLYSFCNFVGISYFVVFVYDEFDSVIKQSTTYIKELEPQESKEIFFTWNEKFEREPIRFDVIELKK